MTDTKNKTTTHVRVPIELVPKVKELVLLYRKEKIEKQLQQVSAEQTA